MFKVNLRKYRVQAGMTGKAMADRLGINDTTYRSYENIDRQPSYDTLKRIAKILNVTVDQLLADEESVTPMPPLGREPVYTPESDKPQPGLLDRGFHAVGSAMLGVEQSMLVYLYDRATSQDRIVVHRILDKYNSRSGRMTMRWRRSWCGLRRGRSLRKSLRFGTGRRRSLRSR